MREIKFRVWWNNEYIDLLENCVVIDHDGIPKTNEYGDLIGMPGVILEQYTGKRDMHKNQIYDGDRIRLAKAYSISSNTIMEEGTIRWCDDGYWCVASDRSINDYNRYNKPLKNFPLDKYEVIGNIHD